MNKKNGDHLFYYTVTELYSGLNGFAQRSS